MTAGKEAAIQPADEVKDTYDDGILYEEKGGEAPELDEALHVPENNGGPEDEVPALSAVELYPADKGKRAWLTVVGAFCGQLASFGYVSSIGVFQEYYRQNQLKDYTASQIAWISSVHIFLVIFFGVIVGRIYDMFGPKWLLRCGSVFMIVGVMTTSLCTEYYQIFLSMTVCTALGSSMLFNPSISSVSGWFVRKRATMIGLTTTGSSLGGVIMPVVFRQVETRAGYGWAVRSLGFIMLAMVIVCCMTVTSRVRPQGRQSVHFKDKYVMPFKSIVFVLVTSGIFFTYWGVFVPIGYVATEALAHGFSENLSLYLPSILNAASIFGRIIPGILADKFGRYNTYIVSAVASCILILALWLPATGHVPIILFSAFYGFFSGTLVSIWPALVADISPLSDLGARIGAVSALVSFASLSGLPIAGAILAHNNNSYWGVCVFSAICIVSSATVMQLARRIYKGGWFVKM
ncbi:major facilitator superfamily domain-containing protein [Limtongia smithiae]|uniref:major facilitator superfamily domain-containing protein n=1 Tax=Limtongia smithiae TaxID=1125753 RepID=UPI0034CD80EE